MTNQQLEALLDTIRFLLTSTAMTYSGTERMVDEHWREITKAFYENGELINAKENKETVNEKSVGTD